MEISEEQKDKKLIGDTFNRWAAGQGSVVDLFSDTAEWTITGAGPLSKTYTSRKQFFDGMVAPLSASLSKQIAPNVRVIYADGDMVIALWNGSAVAKDGKPYKNTYAWFLKIRNGLIVKAIAFFDTIKPTELWEKVEI